MILALELTDRGDTVSLNIIWLLLREAGHSFKNVKIDANDWI